MSRKKKIAEEKVEKVVETIEKPINYKGFNIGWLKEIGESHPEYHLVKEYEDIYGEI